MGAPRSVADYTGDEVTPDIARRVERYEIPNHATASITEKPSIVDCSALNIEGLQGVWALQEVV